MIRKLLIANRGEIAVRVAHTARRMGLATVAVHSDADAKAQHVLICDEAVHIGPSPAADSYLRGDVILAAAKRVGADAIHPGYGFLSENADFAEAVEAAGLVWVGPPASAIRAMGLKDAAKARMETAGVPVVPGYHGDNQDPEFLQGQADRIGYPVLIKARAGGGGKGMRKVERSEDFAEALESAAREGKSSFGDAAVLIEKYVSTPRHVEVQIFADSHGAAVHLHERDCSLQRRHQKVIEEAPAPGMTPDMRAEMGAAAVKAALAVGYRGAGTVEFIADASEGLRPDRFYFMEMNTRLQVEHPVTEEITGQDLVEWQLRIANGEALPLAQTDIPLHGWAVEARLYAEEPAQDFRPATGRLAALWLGSEARIDSGVDEGDVITPFYDPMIAKLIVHGDTREDAFARLAGALEKAEVAGVKTNLAFLARLLRDDDVLAGRVDTGLIARKGAALLAEPAPEALDWALALLEESLADDDADDEPAAPALGAWRGWGAATLTAMLEDQRVCACRMGDGWRVETPAGVVALSAMRNALGEVLFTADGLSGRAQVVREPGAVTVLRVGRAHRFTHPDPVDQAEDGASGDSVAAPLPGVVKAVHVAVGESVEEGDRLITLEAMKMEHTLRSPRAGVVASLGAAAGDQVEDGAVLASLEPQ